ncbi:MAG: Ig-like domain-containing protein [Nanoarchaeota archaeon]
MGVHLMRKLLVPFLLIISLAFCAEALTSSFEATAQHASFSLCQCDAVAERMLVQNTGDLPLTILVEQTGEGAAFATTYPLAFTLQPGKAQEIYSYVSVPCKTSRGGYPLQTTFIADNGVKKQLEQGIQVSRCPNLNVWATKAEAQVLPCQRANFTFFIQNTGKSPETFDISVKPLGEYALLSFAAVEVQPNGTAPLVLQVAPPCNLSGDFDLTLSVLARKSRFLAETPVALSILPYYNYSVTLPQSISLCEADTLAIPVRIQNQAGFSNSFVVEAMGFASQSLQLGTKETGHLNLTGQLVPGERNLTVTVTSVFGKAVYGQNISVSVERCAAVELSAPQYLTHACVGETAWLPFTVKNAGTRAQNLKVKVSPAWAIAPQALQLAPGEQKDIVVGIAPDAEAKEIPVTVEITNSKALASATAHASFVSKQACEYAVVEPAAKTISPMNQTVTFTISNRGVRDANYTLKLDAPDWISLSSPQVSVPVDGEGSVSLQVSPPNLSGTYPVALTVFVGGKDTEYHADLALKVRKPSPLIVWATTFLKAYWMYVLIALLLLIIIIILVVLLEDRRRRKEAQKSKEERDEEAAAAAFRGAEALQDQGMPYNALLGYQDVVNRYRRTPSAREARKRIRRLDKKLRLEAQRSAKQEIVAEKRVEKRQEQRQERRPGRKKKEREPSLLFNILLTLLILLLLIAAIVALYYTTFRRGQQEANATVSETPSIQPSLQPSLLRVLRQDTPLTLNLSTMFSDPDNDPLTFAAAPSEHLSVAINGSLATITPADGWTGEEDLVFNASDGSSVISSPPLSFRVVEGKQSLLQKLGGYRTYIIIGIVALVLLIVFFQLMAKREK